MKKVKLGGIQQGYIFCEVFKDHTMYIPSGVLQMIPLHSHIVPTSIHIDGVEYVIHSNLIGKNVKELPDIEDGLLDSGDAYKGYTTVSDTVLDIYTGSVYQYHERSALLCYVYGEKRFEIVKEINDSH